MIDAAFRSILVILLSLATVAQTLGQPTNAPLYASLEGETYYEFGADPMRYIENDRLKVGFNLAIGGAVVYLEDKKHNSGNMINSYDWGRQIQLSYYSGPIPFIGPNGEQPSSNWAGLGWNPIQAGDCGGYGSRVLSYEQRGTDSAFLRTRPMLWPNIGLLAECVFECEYKLTSNGFELTATIVNDRSDKTQYKGRNQETPALYTNAPWYKLVSYTGDKPFENAPVTVLVDKNDGKGWPWLTYNTTERWSALLNKENFGIGVYQPKSLGSSAGFHGGDASKGKNLGPKSGATGYIAPREVTILDWNIRRTYQTTFIVGSLDEIRATVYKLAKRDLKSTPEWIFENDRQNWIYANTTDEGFPIQGSLKINLLPNLKAVACSPDTFWKTKDAETLEITGSFIDFSEKNPLDDVLTVKIIPFSPADSIDYLQWYEDPKSSMKDRQKEKEHPRLPAISIEAPIRFDGQKDCLRIDLSKIDAYAGAMKSIQLIFPAREGKALIESVRFIKQDKIEQ